MRWEVTWAVGAWQDLVQEAMAAEEADHGTLAALAVWLRLAAMRKLTWNRESNPL